jgi:hypothetical protein
MKTMNTFKRLLTVLLAAAAMSLAACGGGDGGSATTGDLPAGKVGTVGDGVNAAEFEAIQCGMNKDQVMAIVGDGPTNILGDVVLNWNFGSVFTQVAFTTPTGVVKYKGTGSNNKTTVAFNC